MTHSVHRISPSTRLVSADSTATREFYHVVTELTDYIEMPYAHEILLAELPTERVKVGSVAFCSNEAGGATLVFWDGLVWRRVQDRAVAS